MAYPKLTPIVATGGTKPRYLADRFSDVVNVKDFGAKGDGVTNDASAFAAAASHCGQRGTIYVPKGTYLLESDPVTVPNNLNTEQGADPSQNTILLWHLDGGATLSGSGRLYGRVFRDKPYDWFGAWYESVGRGLYRPTPFSKFVVETDELPTCNTGILVAAKAVSAGYNKGIHGIQSYVLNNDTYKTRAWGGYFEVVKLTPQTGSCHGIEIGIVNTDSNDTSGQVSPYNIEPSSSLPFTIGLLIESGGEYSNLEVQPVHAGIYFANGTGGNNTGAGRFKRGIVFGQHSLTGTDGTGSGYGIAIQMARGHVLSWMSSTTIETTMIGSYASTKAGAASLFFNENYFKFARSSDDSSLLEVGYTTSTDYKIKIDLNNSFGEPQIKGQSSDASADVDLYISGQNEGYLKLGSWAYSGTVSAQHYFKVKLRDGKIVKVPCEVVS